ALADGRIFTGRQALDLHLVDTLGGFQQLVRDVAADLGIKGKPKLIYPKEDHPPLFDYLLEQRLIAPLRHLLQQQGLMFLWRPLSSDS
ncbi:MAG: signal peptide peptidase SppA, partial [Desulfuromonas thiophila]|nr:signal peptide peptidase SppA [Desulfuromonas thiophila]